MVFSSSMQVFVPAVAMLAAYMSWLCVVRLPFVLRVIALLMLVVAAVASWQMTDLWTDIAWHDALLGGTFLSNLSLRPGV